MARTRTHAAAALLLLGATLALASTSFPVHRLAQLERTAPLPSARAGSQSASLAGDAMLWATAAARVASANSSLVRKVIVARAAELDVRVAREWLNDRGAAGMLVLLPDDAFASDPQARARWTAAERELLQAELAPAVYFARESDAPVARLLGGAPLRLTASAKAPTVLPDPTLTNLYATLTGKETATAGGLALPTIAIVAGYDVLTAVPAMSAGAECSGSGVVALLELARLYSRLLSSRASRPAFNVAFVLAAGAPLNHAGVQHWLEALPVDTNVEFALCLDQLSGGASVSDEMSLHVSKPPKEPAVARVYDAFVASAAARGVKLSVSQKKVNVATAEVAWPHEHVSLKRALGATLSAAVSPVSPRCDTLDRNASAVQIARNVAIVADAIARLAFPQATESASLFQGPFAVDEAFVSAWAQTVSKTPRSVPHHTARNGPVVQSLRRALAAAAGEVTEDAWAYSSAAPAAQQRAQTDDEDEQQTQTPAPRYRFYTTHSTVMTADVVAPATWNLLFTVVVASFLFGLYSCINGLESTKAELAQLFSSQARKPKKN